MAAHKKSSIAGIITVLGLVIFAGMVYFIGTSKVPPDSKDLFNMALMADIGWVGIAFNYYLGSSESSAKKSETIAAIKKGENV
jgi:hypothetical protein